MDESPQFVWFKFKDILECARSCKVSGWSRRTGKRALGWAKVLEQLTIPDLDDDDRWCCKHARAVLLKTLLQSYFINESFEPWVRIAYVKYAELTKEDLKRDILEKELTREIISNSFLNEEIHQAVVFQKKLYAQVTMTDLIKSKTARTSWEVKFENKAMTSRDLALFIEMTRLSFSQIIFKPCKEKLTRLRSIGGDFPLKYCLSKQIVESLVASSPDTYFKTWCIGMMLKHGTPMLWSFDGVLEICKLDLHFASMMFSNLVVNASCAWNLGKSMQAEATNTIRTFAQIAPWIRKLVLTTLKSSKKEFARKILWDLQH